MTLLDPQHGIFFSLLSPVSLEKTPNLLPSELPFVAKAGEKRKREFALGRSAARSALKEAGLVDCKEIIQGDSGQPLWPTGFSGSISHCSLKGNIESLRAAAIAAKGTSVKSLGIDIEYSTRTYGDGLSSKVCTAEELLELQARLPQTPFALTQILCAKEALFKALYPLHGVFFGFQDAALSWDEKSSSFNARLLRDLSPDFRCGYSAQIKLELREELVLAWLEISA